MHNLRRFWNQNKNQIIKIFGIIFFVFLIIQIANFVVKKQNEDKMANVMQNSTNSANETSTNTNTKESKGLVSNQSAVSGEEVSESELEQATDLIYNFVTYCNNQDLENAYNLLTDECKQQMYTSVDIFRQAYYNDVFNGQKKTCTIENWINNTYKVDIKEDALATGKSTGYSKQDYITIENVNGENKLNINNYIGYTEMSEETTDDNITMKMVGINTYKDYEEYTVSVTNKTENIIQLDDVNNTKTLYLKDSNGMKYYYYNHELTNQTLTIAAGQTKDVTIKFYSAYVSNKEIENIVFTNIISKGDSQNSILQFTANI